MMNDFHSFFRLVLPGYLLGFFLLPIAKHLPFLGNIEDAGLGLALIWMPVGYLLHIIYMSLYHHLFEEGKMQSQEYKWLNKHQGSKNDIIKCNSKIWFFIENDKENGEFAKWLRNNFSIMHSAGASMLAIVISLLVYIFRSEWYYVFTLLLPLVLIKVMSYKYKFDSEKLKLPLALVAFIVFVILNAFKEFPNFQLIFILLMHAILIPLISYYRQKLKDRYMNRLELYITTNRENIITGKSTTT